jgi:hypothetical protein
VAVRLPPFWPDRPALWFAQAKERFELTVVTRQRKKFKCVVSQVHQQHAAEVKDIIANHRCTSRLSTSREQRMKQLSHEEICDRKPTHFLRHLTQNVPDDFLRTFWASRLLPHVQAILAGQTEGSLDTASHVADRVCEVTQPTTSSVSPSVPDKTAGLLERVEDLSLQVASQTRSR